MGGTEHAPADAAQEQSTPDAHLLNPVNAESEVVIASG